MLKQLLEIITEFYAYPLPIFREEKEPEKLFSYQSFQIENFRGLDNVSINFSKNDLILLLGLNESGKTSILKAIEAFDFNNDPQPENLKQFFTSIRNKQDIECNDPCTITAEISFIGDLNYNFFKKVLRAAEFDATVKGEVEAICQKLSEEKNIFISRVIPFNNGNPGKSYYTFDNRIKFSDQKLGSIIAQEIIRKCPFILYFEDFQDAIPDKIYTSSRNPAFNLSWYEIIDGLFYNTDSNYSISKFEKYFSKTNPREDDASTVLKKVNKTLQKTFTEKWENLSGVQEIEDAEIIYNSAKKYFAIKITEKDGTTYSVKERSKGAVWYLAFLMKTEFRRKKLREGSGKPVYLIDEPASNLHSTAQQKMVGDFSALVEDTSLVYTTHSRYLISPSNVKNTYVVQRSNGVVQCIKWGEYIKGKDAKISYYQPLFDCLNVVPSNFDMPWENAIITEGPSDALVLEFMQVLLGQKATHAIYPGTSANDLGTLISLNIGWNANFRVLLDSDKDGRENKEKYKKNHGLTDDAFVLLPGQNTEIEDMFSDKEKVDLAEIALGETVAKVSKNQFLAIMRSLMLDPVKHKRDANKILTDKTKATFEILLENLKADKVRS
ncbi:ATP-dependent nuclease [Croceicoccus sediminis]|uniref:ATP-dependent nuclease n=1 Tax=Croceicoccus sediminis TaxID=2571150 RepID=UPI0011832BB3|nr:AAA family ATPase [Croceicoccus sediminis]